MKHARIVIVGMLYAALCSSVSAGGSVCTQEEAIQAETEASTLRDWNSVHESFKHFAHCDDAAIAEGYSDSVARLLSENWNDIDVLNSWTKSDAEFKQFVLRHIDMLMTPSQAKRIGESALQDCPPRANSLCNSILVRLAKTGR